MKGHNLSNHDNTFFIEGKNSNNCNKKKDSHIVDIICELEMVNRTDSNFC